MTPDLLAGIHRNPRRESALKRIEMAREPKASSVSELKIPVRFTVSPGEINRVVGVVRDAVATQLGDVDVNVRLSFELGPPEL